MSSISSMITRRTVLASAAAAGAVGLFAGKTAVSAGDSEAIRPFQFKASDEQLTDLHNRLLATRLPEKETVNDFSQGVPLKTIKQVLQHWQTNYDWRKVEARINSYPNFITEIDGLDIHFIHARSKHEDAMPIIITHGWPGSIVEQLKIIGPLTDPTAHGGDASDAFHVVIPSMPGFGFSGKPETTGWGPERIASAWITLMRRLGYDRFAAQEVIGVELSPTRSPCRPRRSCSASTPTSPKQFLRRLTKRLSLADQLPQVCLTRRRRHTNSSRSSISMSTTPSKWELDHKPWSR